MPTYGFACAACGPFEVRRGAEEAGRGAACPGCGASARRVFTPPSLARVSRPVRGLFDLQEKSAHEPAVVGDKRGAPLGHAHAHGPAPPWVLGH
jgi:putative FmdB family regulatory protein